MSAFDDHEAAPVAVYAVICSNYEPAETDSLWTTKERAEERAEELDEKGGDWRVVAWTVRQ